MATHESEAGNVEVVRRALTEGFGGGDLDLIDDLVAPEFVGHGQVPSESIRGPEELRRTIEMYRAGVPDIAFELHETLADGDLVAVRWTSRGTHEGELMGVEPTGTEVEVDGVEIDRVVDGRIVESWVAWDALGLLQQIGAVPETADQ